MSQSDLDSAPSAELLLLARQGDRRALDALFARYVGPLQRWARGRLPARLRYQYDTDDLVQDAFLKTVTRLDAFEPRGRGALGAYLRQIVRNRVVDLCRGAAPRESLDREGCDEPGIKPTALEQVVERQELEQYDRALQSLDEADRNLIVSRIEFEWSYAQIAVEFGKPTPEAARMAVSRAILKLARLIDHDGRA